VTTSVGVTFNVDRARRKTCLLTGLTVLLDKEPNQHAEGSGRDRQGNGPDHGAGRAEQHARDDQETDRKRNEYRRPVD
jgi:hypothetical protein